MPDVEHHVEVVDGDWAERAADVFAAAIEEAVDLRGRCVFGISGGRNSKPAFDALAGRDLPWSDIVLVQVDERIAPSGSAARNLTDQTLAFSGLPVGWLPLPVETPPNSSASTFVRHLQEIAGSPPVLDVVHLGLGDDGHTASLVAGDDAIDELDDVIALTDVYRGWRRITLTRPVLDRARLLVWLVKGSEKRVPLNHLLRGSSAIPAGLLRPRRSIVITDRAAHPEQGSTLA